MTEKTTTNFKRKTAFTVFFRYSPSDSSITRKHFESFFSDVGPVKKCSLIRQNKEKVDDNNTRREAKGYGFCKFTCKEDAVSAAKTLNETHLQLDYGQKAKVWVELADVESADKKKDKLQQQKKKVNVKANANRNGKDVGDTDTDAVVTAASDAAKADTDLQQLQAKKRTSRVILRNLSFYATEHNIRQVMEEKFGEVLDVHLPLVPLPTQADNDKNGQNKRPRRQQQQHRGFAFVTFANPRSAHKAVEACASEEQVLVKKRPVAIDFSISKFQHKRMQQEEEEDKATKDDSGSEQDSGSESDGEESDPEEEDESEDDDDSSSSSNSDSDEEMDESDQEDGTKQTKIPENSHQHSLFLRNLPFDATRHDLFTLFSQYGHIAGIYLVKDKATGVGRGTAFVKFSKEGGCIRAFEASNGTVTDENSQFQSGKNLGAENGHTGTGIYLGGRKIFVDLAVDKNTADSLKVERDDDGKPIDKKIGKDKRNLYLKGEGRVEHAKAGDDASYDPDAWESLPESDQMKRSRAHQDRSTKLRSPLFFINPFRLSIRNLSKHVEESQLKALVVQGVKNGLENKLVQKDDIIAHWRAGGEMSKRDILEKVALSKKEGGLIPDFNENKIKQFIPSVFIDRDFQVPMRQADQSKGSRLIAPSRGFGFVEFTHHAHALACLRELNNNTDYSVEYVSGGKKALEMKAQMSRKRKKKQKKLNNASLDEGPDARGFVGDDGTVRIPRLVMEFTVENKAKARKQAERKAVQQANLSKQKTAARQKSGGTGIAGGAKSGEEKKKKKGRGAQQREKKRKMKEQGLVQENGQETKDVPNKKRRSEPNNDPPTEKKKALKPPKKTKKIDKDEKNFEDMVRSYKQAFSGNINVDGDVKKVKNPRAEVEKKRWFDD